MGIDYTHVTKFGVLISAEDAASIATRMGFDLNDIMPPTAYVKSSEMALHMRR